MNKDELRVIESIRTTASDRLLSGREEMNILLPKGKKIPGSLIGQWIDTGSKTHDMYVVKCMDVVVWASRLLGESVSKSK